MKNDLTPEQLRQPVTITISLGSVLSLAELEAPRVMPPIGRYDILPDCLPEIGQLWVGSKDDDIKNGSIYCGLTLRHNAPMALLLLPGDEELSWPKASEWAKAQGGELPSRQDALVLFQNLKPQFKPEYYWTSEEYPGNADSAWIATFSNGDQYWGRKSCDYRCRAVRRVAI